ncbi:hypothetical protein [Skermanella stibiiresistens]|uniref:hypothetical protein n=1 Tax=Skermanella stibiiresistens TaxID=913326 RepID=UPI0004B593D6|nr:hypothetical protein [Skermanella stibiiresistens]
MRTGTVLLQRSTEGLEPYGAFNQPVHKSHSQIRTALLNELGPLYADYFPRPDADPDGRRIGWLSQKEGKAVRWIDMSPEEQARLQPIKNQVLDGLSAYVAKLRDTPGNSSRNNFSLVLEKAQEAPGPEYLYFVGDQPMLAFWGFKGVGQPHGVNPLRLAPTMVRFEPTVPPPVIPPVTGGTGIPAGTPPAAVGWPWWKWLLVGLGALLFLLLLLWLLWWLFAPRFGLPSIPFIPGLQQEEPTRDPLVPLEEVPVMPGVPGVVVPGAPGVTIPGVGVPGGEIPAPGGTIPEGTNPVLPETTPPIEPPVAPPTEPPSDPTGGQIPPNLPELPPQGAPAGTPGTPLALPDGTNVAPGPATFMQGVWRSRSGLRDGQGRPLEQLYRFDQNGKGEVTVRGPGGTACKAPAEAVVTAGKDLSIREGQTLTCADGTTMSGAETNCGKRPDQTVGCSGKNKADGSEFDVRMEKVK